MASSSSQPSNDSSDNTHQPLRNPITGYRLGGGTDLSVSEILALPEQERNELAERMGVICWEPFTVRAIGTPGDAYSHITREKLPTPEPIPDFDSEEEVERKVTQDGSSSQEGDRLAAKDNDRKGEEIR